MPGILDMIMGAQNGATVSQIGNQFNLDQNQTQNALKHLIPALSGGVKRNVQQEGGLDSLMAALQNGNHGRYLDSPQQVTQQNAINEGNGILGHIFGSKQVSREVAQRASNQTGIDSSILKKMLPMAATMFMGSLNKQGQGNGLMGMMSGGAPAPQKQQASGLLGKMLDQDGDGSIADDLFGMAGKLFG